MAKRKYYWRVVTSNGQKTSNPDWSERDAMGFAKFAVRVGAKGACVERASRYPGARHGPFNRVRCVGKP